MVVKLDTKATHPPSRGGLLAWLRMDEQFESIVCYRYKDPHMLSISHVLHNLYRYVCSFNNERINGLLFIVIAGLIDHPGQKWVKMKSGFADSTRRFYDAIKILSQSGGLGPDRVIQT